MDKTNQKQAVGAQIPDRLYQVINLHSLSRNISRSQIVRDSLLLWIEKNNMDVNELIQELKREFEAEWRRVKNGEEPVTKKEFIYLCKDELDDQKVSEQIIERIFEDF